VRIDGVETLRRGELPNVLGDPDARPLAREPG
jgi:hypothetical protein